MEKMLEKAREIKGLKKKISREAKRVGLKCNTEERQSTMFKVFQKIYYAKVKTLLGLDHRQRGHFVSYRLVHSGSEIDHLLLTPASSLMS